MRNKVIVFGNPLFSVKDLKEPDVSITYFAFNHQTMEIEINYEIGLQVSHINISVFSAIEEGLINLNVLNKIL